MRCCLQISDLQRLLEMYARWQQRVYPHKSFDDFIVSLEKLSGTFTIKHKMRQRRTVGLHLGTITALPLHVRAQGRHQRSTAPAL